MAVKAGTLKTNRMEELNDINRYNLMRLEGYDQKWNPNNIQKLSEDTQLPGNTAIPRGYLEEKIYTNYYDRNDTITNALANPTAPSKNDPDDPNYNRERVFVALERNAPKVWISNDAAVGGPTIFFIVSHGGETQWSSEQPVYPKEIKVYKNVWELRLRSPVAGTPYRVTEYDLIQA